MKQRWIYKKLWDSQWLLPRHKPSEHFCKCFDFFFRSLLRTVLVEALRKSCAVCSSSIYGFRLSLSIFKLFLDTSSSGFSNDCSITNMGHSYIPMLGWSSDGWPTTFRAILSWSNLISFLPIAWNIFIYILSKIMGVNPCGPEGK
jgi:hypothetical protein